MWDDTAFRRRIKERADALGKKLPKKLSDRIRYKHVEAPRIDLILDVAEWLDWSVPEALGLDIRPPEQVNIQLLARAIEAANRIGEGRTPHKRWLSFFADEAAALYAVMAERERTETPVTERELDLLIASAIARFDLLR